MDTLLWRRLALGLACLIVPAVIVLVALTYPAVAFVPLAIILGLTLFLVPKQKVRGAGLGLATAVLVFAGSNSAPGEIRVAAVAVAVAAVVAVSLIAGRPTRKGRGGAFATLLTYVVYASLLSLVAGSSSIATLLASFSAVVAIAVLVRRCGAEDIQVFVRWVIAIALVQVLIGVAELTVLSEPIWGYRNVTTSGVPVLRYNPFLGDAVLRTQGSFGHPIPFALFMVFTFFISLLPGVRTGKVLRITGVSVALVGLLLSGTRSAVLAFVVAFVYYAISSRGFTAKARNVFVILVAIVIVMVGDFGIREVVTDLMASDSLAHRVDGWSLAYGLLGRSPLEVFFGTGVNSELATFQAGYLQQDGFNVIDNQWLTVFVTTGVLGLVVFAIALIVGWIRADRTGRALIVTCLMMFFSFDVTTWPASFFLLAIALCLPDLRGEDPTPVAPPSPALEKGFRTA